MAKIVYLADRRPETNPMEPSVWVLERVLMTAWGLFVIAVFAVVIVCLLIGSEKR